MKHQPIMVTTCCQSVFWHVGGKGLTHWYVCNLCGNACDVKERLEADE